MAEQRPSWDEYFLALAEQISRRSPDPSTRHGCVLVDADNRVISTGYNGPVFARCDLRGATAYVTGAPCAGCFRRFLQVGIRRIVHGGLDSACIMDSERAACELMARQLGVEVCIRSGKQSPATGR
jgi:deoxycytidylate deaminase